MVRRRLGWGGLNVVVPPAGPEAWLGALGSGLAIRVSVILHTKDGMHAKWGGVR